MGSIGAAGGGEGGALLLLLLRTDVYLACLQGCHQPQPHSTTCLPGGCRALRMMGMKPGEEFMTAFEEAQRCGAR